MHKAIVFGRLACRARQFHSSRYAAKLVVEKVPALGESITEGSIASWTKAVGDRVAVDDVIVIVETDKVTVDIKSTYAGVLTRKIATDIVIVGTELYEIDTDGTAAAPAAAPAAAASTPAAAAAPAAGAQAHNEGRGSDKHREPSIKFVGKRDRTQKHAAPAPVAAPAAPVAAPKAQPTPVQVREGNGVHFTSLKGMALFGRPVLTQREIDAIESGGATM